MRIFMDTEFMEDGEVIIPLSLGFVREDGEMLYVVITDVDRSLGNEFVQLNVIPYLDMQPGDVPITYATRAEAKDIIRHFCGDRPEFWAWYCAYDWIVMCQLFGTMMDLPYRWPLYSHDLKQEADRLGTGRMGTLPDSQSLGVPAHHCLRDALEVKWRYEAMDMDRFYDERRKNSERVKFWKELEAFKQRTWQEAVLSKRET